MNPPNQSPAGLIRRTFLTLAALALLTAPASAQVPTMISYQGRVLMDNANFNGTGQFKFALVQGAGPTLLWKNDASAGNTEPAAAVSLSVANGLVMTTLGDTALANMTAIPASVFNNADVRLRVWFNGGAGFQQLTPDQRIVSVGYSLMAHAVADGAITAAKLANGAVTSAKIANDAIGAAQIAPGAVNSSDIADGSILGADIANNTITGLQIANSAITSVQLADDLDLGDASTVGRLDVFRTTAGTPGVSIIGNGSQISTYGSDGLEQIRLWGPGYGELLLNNALVNNATAVNLTAQGSTGGRLSLNNTNGSSRAILEGENTGGLLTLYTADGNAGAILYGNEGGGSGALSLRDTNGSPRFRAYGGPLSGRLDLLDTNGTRTVLLEAAEGGGTAGSQLVMYQANGVATIQLDAEVGTGGGGYFALYNAAGVETVTLEADEVVGDGGQLVLRNNAGTATIVLDANQGTEGRITTQVLTITGGSDLSENFDVNDAQDELQPGMIVSIDPKNPGELVLSRSAYDHKVAGIVSGAGGVKTGMLMGQAGTKADGKHAVALTGRVYCQVDASFGAIEPGDMITTSTTPGHGMKATDRERAFGSIIGKAMTGLTEGKGLVLVLVNLQ
jgi:hypothetical protein